MLVACSSNPGDPGGDGDAGTGTTSASPDSGDGPAASTGSATSEGLDDTAGSTSSADTTGDDTGDPVDPDPDERLRVIVETDLGGDQDDQASFVRFLLYSNEWDVEGILIERHPDQFQNDGVASNPTNAATSLEMAYDYLDVYGSVYEHLSIHDPRYPAPAALEAITVEAHDDASAGVELLIEALMRDDDRPIWYGNWGSNSGTTSNLQRALQTLEQDDPGAFVAALAKLRVATLDGANPRIDAAYAEQIPLYVETGWPQLGGDIESRWYRRFDDITGPYLEPSDLHAFEALYTGEKEGDTWSFVYLLPNGLNAPDDPTWGGAAGRYLPRTLGPNHFWNEAEDTWNGSTNRDNTAARWAEALQNDFKARLDWAQAPAYADANHPPALVIDGSEGTSPIVVEASVGERLVVDGAGSSDPDGDALSWDFIVYPEVGGHDPDVLDVAPDGDHAAVLVTEQAAGQQVHVIVAVTDGGSPPLTRYRRVIIDVQSQ